MNELTRAQYLDVLGIDTFVPRFVLPAAKPSVLCNLPRANARADVGANSVMDHSDIKEFNRAGTVKIQSGHSKPVLSIAHLLDETAKPQSNATDASTSITSAQNNASLNQHVDSVVKEALVGGAVGRSNNPVVAQAAISNTAKFSLGLWQSKDTLFVDSRRAGDALPTQALLLNIMHSVGLDGSGLTKEEILNWPLVQTDSDQSWEAARAMVSSFLDGRLFSRPCSRFLIFGKDAYQAVIGEKSHFLEQLYAEISLELFEAKTLVLPSLSDMLYKPELKRAVWIAAQNFCAE